MVRGLQFWECSRILSRYKYSVDDLISAIRTDPDIDDLFRELYTKYEEQWEEGDEVKPPHVEWLRELRRRAYPEVSLLRYD